MRLLAKCFMATLAVPLCQRSPRSARYGRTTPCRPSRNPRRCAKEPNRSSNRAAYPSSGPGAAGHGRRWVITHPRAGHATTSRHTSRPLQGQQTTASRCPSRGLAGYLNLVILAGIVKIFRAMRRGEYNETELERQLDNRGFFYRFFGPWMRVISKKWQMYPVGVIFGMGFDTVADVPARDDHRVPGL
jgi:High-affinity nickel-transport protein